MERIILTTGGTGGHIFPALAVAEEIRSRWPGCMILFMGSTHGPEADLAAQAGLDFAPLPVRGIMGRGLKGAGAAIGLVRSLLTARAILRKVKPQAVVGFGGYASFPGVFAGIMQGIPTAIHEQNSLPGAANRLLGKMVKRVYLSLPDAVTAFPTQKTLLVGNPIRAAIASLYQITPEELPCTATDPADQVFDTAYTPATCAPHGPRLLVMGGSLGARALNQAVVTIVESLLIAGVELWHQTGQSGYEATRARYQAIKSPLIRVEPFISNVQQAYAWADLILCRAGGSSLAEITAAGLPAVLVPFPFATKDHQSHNARFMEQAGAALVLPEQTFSGDKNGQVLVNTLLALLADKKRLADMARQSSLLGRPHAARDLVNDLQNLLPIPALGQS